MANYVDLPVLGGAASFPNPADANLNMDTFHILSSGGNNKWTVQPSDGEDGIKLAIEAAVAAGGGIVELLAGTYSISQPIVPNNFDLAHNVTIRGTGNVILEADGSGFSTGDSVLLLEGFVVNCGKNISATSVGDTSITCTTPGDASNYKTGDILVLAGTDTSSIQDLDGFYVVSADGNPLTGNVPFVNPIRQSLSSATTFIGVRSGTNNRVENITIRIINSAPAMRGLRTANQFGFVCSDVRTEGFDACSDDVSQGSLSLAACINSQVTNCTFGKTANEALTLDSSLFCRINDSIAISSQMTGGSGGAFSLADSCDCEVIDNIINASAIYGLECAGTRPSRRNVISRNAIARCIYGGVYGGSKLRDSIISNNLFEDCGVSSDSGLYLGSERNTIIGNTLHRCYHGMIIQNGNASVISGNTILSPTGSGIVCGVTNTGSSILGNTIIGGSSAIYLDTAIRCQITGNSITDCSSVGITLASGTLASNISGNTVSGSGAAGISLVNADNCIVSTNHISNTSFDGISIDASSDNNLVLGNHVVDSSGISNLGTNNDLISNKLT